MATTVPQDGAPPHALRLFRTLTAPHRLRVGRDAEGWPVCPGTYGRLEYHDRATLSVYCPRPRLFGRLWEAGATPWQVGSTEARGLLPHEALPAVAGVIRARTRRTLTPEAARQKGAGTAYRGVSGG